MSSEEEEAPIVRDDEMTSDQIQETLNFNMTNYTTNETYVIDQNSTSIFSGILGRIDQVDYSFIQERALDVALQPYNYVMH